MKAKELEISQSKEKIRELESELSQQNIKLSQEQGLF